MKLAGCDRFSRITIEDTTVGTTRSDRTDKLCGVPIVVVEETDDLVDEAVEDIIRKRVWLPHFNGIPFMFGLAISITALKICKLTSSDTIVIFEANLNMMSDRIRSVLAVVNIARALRLFSRNHLIVGSLPFYMA